AKEFRRRACLLGQTNPWKIRRLPIIRQAVSGVSVEAYPHRGQLNLRIAPPRVIVAMFCGTGAVTWLPSGDNPRTAFYDEVCVAAARFRSCGVRGWKLGFGSPASGMRTFCLLAAVSRVPLGV